MPFKDASAKKANDRSYYAANKEAIKKRERDKYVAERSTIRARRKELSTPELRAKNAERERLRYAAYRKIVLDAYGGQCACCEEAHPLFLEIDHINGDGAIHRKEIGRDGRRIVYWLIQNSFPDNFQLLCSNCNQGKKRNGGVCPHKQ